MGLLKIQPVFITLTEAVLDTIIVTVPQLAASPQFLGCIS